MPRVCVFDVNETLLDLRALDPLFVEAFGTADARREWFNQMLQSAFVATITERYHPFHELGAAALEMTAARREVLLSEYEMQTILGWMRRLPPHEDVHDALTRLRDAGVRLAALTNSTLEVADAQLTHAGLRDLFEQVLSADTVQRLKPAPEPYQMAAKKLGVSVGQVRLIAAHAWDVAGALHAGCAAAFVARPGQVFDPLAARPDVVAENLRDVAALILEAERA